MRTSFSTPAAVARLRAACHRTAFFWAACLTMGCASTSPEKPFKDTKNLVAASTGRRIAWSQAGDDDAAVQKRVRALLAKELTVDGAVEVALLENKHLQATYEELSIAQADLVQAGLLANPVLGGGISFPVAGHADTGFDLSVSEDFLGIFMIAAKKRVAEAELSAMMMRVAGAVLDTAHDVEVAYYELEAEQQVAAMRHTLLDADDAALESAKSMYAAGNLNDLDLAQQQAVYEQTRTDVVQSDAAVTAARENLTRLLGVWGTSVRVSPKLPELPGHEPSLEELEPLALRRRFDLRAAHEDARAASEALDMGKSYRFFGGAEVGGAYERSPEGFSTLGPRAGLEVPIFDQKQAMIARLGARFRAAKAREEALGVDARSEVRAARARLDAARAVVERYAKVVVPLRERVVALSQVHYNAMLLGIVPLLQAKQAEVNAYRELIESLREYWTARAELERSTGGKLPGALAAPAMPAPPPTTPPPNGASPSSSPSTHMEHAHDHP